MKTLQRRLTATVAMACVLALAGMAEAGRTVTTTVTTTTTTVPKATVTGKIRLTVAQTGLHRVTAAEVATLLGSTAAAVTTEIQNGRMKLTNVGLSVSWMPKADNTEIYFYGQKVENRFGALNTYWLDVGVAGVKMSGVSQTAPTPVTKPGFTDTASFEKDGIAAAKVFFNPNDDFWMWDCVMPPYAGYTSKSFPFVLDGVAASSGSAQVSIGFQGGLDTATANPDNLVTVYVNGQQVGQSSWDGAVAYQATYSFPQSYLVTGSNTLLVAGAVPAGASSSLTYVDSFSVTWLRPFEAVAGNLVCKSGGNTVISVTKFATSDVKVFNITSPLAPKYLSSGVKIDSLATGYRASFKPTNSSTPYLTAALSAAKAPASMTKVVTAGLAAAANQADYVVIAPDSLSQGAAALAAHRTAQGLISKVVTLQSIYDEFNYGFADPLAIQSFLASALANWTVKPRYVVLAGEGSYDFANVKGFGDCLVPPLMTTSPYGLVVSDSLMADTDADGVPNVAIGRLPVINDAELQALVTKIANYEAGGTWKDRMMMVADNADTAGDYPVLADSAAALAPAEMTVEKAYLSNLPLATVRTAMFGAINSGARVINYTGHALQSKLATEGILTATDVASLNNGVSAPVVFAMACHFGHFGSPGSDAVSESLVVKPDGGAVAVWAAANYAYAAESQIMNEAAFGAMFVGGAERVGDAIRAGLEKYHTDGHMAYMAYIYNLLGDPATLISNSGL